jgi:hypothetical protein
MATQMAESMNARALCCPNYEIDVLQNLHLISIWTFEAESSLNTI